MDLSRLDIAILLRSAPNDGQDDVGRPGGVVVDRVVGDDRSALLAERLASVPVGIPEREVGAGDLQPNAVAGHEAVTGRLRLDRNLVDLAWLHVLLVVEAVP